MKLASRLGAEFLGTYVLVLGGTGAAVFAAAFMKDGEDTGLGIGLVHSLDIDVAAEAVEGGLWTPGPVQADELPARFGFVRSPQAAHATVQLSTTHRLYQNRSRGLC